MIASLFDRIAVLCYKDLIQCALSIIPAVILLHDIC